MAGGQTTDCRPCWAVPNESITEWAPHGDKLYAGEAEGRRAIWVDAAPTLAVTPKVTAELFLAGIATPFPVLSSVALWRWDGSKWVMQETKVGDGIASSVSFDVLIPAYYSLTFGADLALVGGDYTLAISHSTTADSWAHAPLPGLNENRDSVNAIRIMGTSFKLRNEASPLNRQGTFVMMQAPKGRGWQDYAFPDNAFTLAPMFDYVFGLNGEIGMSLDKGGYIFLKPSEASDFSLQQPFDLEDFGVADACFPIKPEAGFIVCAMSATSAGAGDLYGHFDYACEYNTENPWFTIEAPYCLPEAWRAGIEAIASMQQVYENPWHFSDILGTIGKLARVATPILSALHPGAGWAAGMVGGALRKRAKGGLL